ncbi:MAG: FG-GAP-like repeat-containing protein, partial [Akkermansiaceae bacterium]|nr:FG-GAP-like repeat-containing protein [Akkermansiaceae bacterium]
MKCFIRLIACIPMMWVGPAHSQELLNLQESPPAGGLFTAQVADSYVSTGIANAKLWVFNAEGGDKMSFYIRTANSSNSRPILRLTNSGGSTVAESTGAADGFGSLENVQIPNPGIYQIAVFSNTNASEFSLHAMLGRRIGLEAENNDRSELANTPSSVPQAGGFRNVVAGVLDRNPDWSDLGILAPGDSVNLSLQSPSASTLATAGAVLALFKDANTTPLVTATGTALVHTVAATGRYRVRLQVPDLDGRNLHFTGGQSVNLDNPAALQITGSQTIEFWIKPDDFGSRQNPYAKAYGGEGTMTLETNGTINYFYGTGGGNNSPYQTFNSDTSLRAGRWQHLALVRDFTSDPKQLRWYLDGKLVAQADTSYFPATASSLPLTLATGYAGDLRGSMDEVRIWNTARSAAEISDNLDNALVGDESGLVAYYRFGEGSGDTTADTTANAITGTLTGSPAWEGSSTANLAHFTSQGQNASYLLTAIIGDTSAPGVLAVTPEPVSGLPLQGTTFAPANMTALRGNDGEAYLYTLTGSSSGNIWGTDIYTDDSSLAKAAVHAGVLQPGETGTVRVTVLAGAPSYTASTRNGVTSSSHGGYAGSYSIERYTPASPFPLDRLYASLSVVFSEPMIASSLASGVTLVAAGADATFGTADDINYPVTFTGITLENLATFTFDNSAILSPGTHRLTIPVTVTDRASNQMATPHVEEFTVLGIMHYASELGDNNTQATADPLSLNVSANQPDGSFSDFDRTTAIAGRPYDIELADLDGDGSLDAVITHLGSVDGVRMYPGNGDLTFGTPITFDGLGDEPHDADLLDWDKDGDLDVAVTVYGQDLMAFFRNDSTPGAMAFTRVADVTVGDQPLRAAVGDVNGDTYPDLVVANRGTDATTGRCTSVLLNDKNGSFVESKIGLEFTPKIRPFGIGLGDFNKDGKLDLAAADQDNDTRVAIMLGVGDGTFGAPTFLEFPTGWEPSDIVTADFNQDGNPDLAVSRQAYYAREVSIYPGNGDGTFGDRVNVDLGSGYHCGFLRVEDFNGDSWPDLLVPGYDALHTVTNRADGSFGFNSVRRNWNGNYGADLGDLNGDGLPEIVVIDHDTNLLRVLDGNPDSPLLADDTSTDLLHGYGRGFRSASDDVDYWSFTARRGEVLTIAVDHAELPGNPGLNWYVYDEVGTNLTSFYNGVSGYRGQTPPLVIPRDGTYYLRVSSWHDYRGEYRFRATLAPPGTQVETEDNNAISQSDPVAFTLSGNTLSATTAGYIAGYDTNGDYFNLGNLAAGTQVNATLRLPSSSTLEPTLALFKQNGTEITPTTLTPTALVYTLQTGDDSTYHLRVKGAAGLGVMAEYFVDLTLTDVEPPTIVSNSMPAEGSTVTFFGSSFTLGFSEDMIAATVNNTANYQLLGSGGDGTFDDGNEIVYTVNSPGYSSGLGASYFMPDGPMQPDSYRFTASSALKDKLNNNLTADHVRNFTIEGVPGWVLEDRDNNTQATADTLSLNVAANQSDGSFADFGRTTPTAGWPFDVELADLDGDGKLDAVTTHLGSVDGLRIHRGNGDKTFTTYQHIPAGTGLQTFSATYYDNNDLTGTSISRTDEAINFNWGYGSPDPTIDVDTFSARWEGSFISPHTGLFSFATTTDDGTRLWIDLDRSGTYEPEELLIDKWITQGTTTYTTPLVTMTSGLSYGVKMEYFEQSSPASAVLTVVDPFTALGDEPHDAELLDWDQDGDLDIAVTVYGSDKVALFRNDSTPGTMAFSREADVTVGDYPRMAAAGDVNGDTWPDLVVSNYGTNATTGRCISVLLNDQAGSFTESKIGTELSPKIRPYGIGLGDFNQDGDLDLAVGDTENDTRVAVMLGAGDGTFGDPTFLDFPSGWGPSDIVTADFNQDGNPDLAVSRDAYYAREVSIYPGNGDGTFGDRINIDLGSGYHYYFLKTADFNGDGWPDLLAPGYDALHTATNRADGTFGFNSVRRNWNGNYGADSGDLDGDGLPEIVVIDHDENLLRVLDGNPRAPLAADDTTTDLVHGYGRGFLTDNNDVDYWSFTAKRGEVLTIAVDHSTISGNPGLNWYVYDEVGTNLTSFYNGVSGYRGQTPPLVIPRDGTYYLRVSPWHDYRGEYRFRTTLAAPGTQVETEDNNAISQSDPVTFTLSGNSLSATTGGYVAGYDTNGDYFNLGNLAAGTQVSASLRLPSTSTLAPVLTLFKANGTQITPDTLTSTQLIYILQPGDESTYHIRVTDSAGRGLMAEYFL